MGCGGVDGLQEDSAQEEEDDKKRIIEEFVRQTLLWLSLCCAVVFVLYFEPRVSGNVQVGQMCTFLAVRAADGFDSAI